MIKFATRPVLSPICNNFLLGCLRFGNSINRYFWNFRFSMPLHCGVRLVSLNGSLLTVISNLVSLGLYSILTGCLPSLDGLISFVIFSSDLISPLACWFPMFCSKAHGAVIASSICYACSRTMIWNIVMLEGKWLNKDW